jgi:hypothetical protein
MKKILLFAGLFVIASIVACGQTDSKVPEKVKTTFSQKFPGAIKVKWDMENDTEWEAEFKMDGKEYSANFDLSGTWMETEYEISASDLPKVVQATIDKEFAGAKFEEGEVSETANGKVFELELKTGKKEMDVSIDTNGKVLSKEQAEEDTDGEEEND